MIKPEWHWFVSPEGGNAALWLVGAAITLTLITELFKITFNMVHGIRIRREYRRKFAKLQESRDAEPLGPPLVVSQPPLFEPMTPVRGQPKSSAW